MSVYLNPIWIYFCFTGHHIKGNWGTCGLYCPHTKALEKLEKCLIEDKMPLYGNGDCYSLFEQGPCNDGEWFVLNSAINGTFLPYAHCEKTLSCDVFTLTADYEGKNILTVYYFPYLKLCLILSNFQFQKYFLLHILCCFDKLRIVTQSLIMT